MLRHIFPNCIAPLIVLMAVAAPEAILVEASLSFLGLGSQPPAASWGNMLSGAQTYVFSYPWLAIYPGVMILLTIVSVNLLGDAVRDSLHRE